MDHFGAEQSNERSGRRFKQVLKGEEKGPETKDGGESDL